MSSGGCRSCSSDANYLAVYCARNCAGLPYEGILRFLRKANRAPKVNAKDEREHEEKTMKALHQSRAAGRAHVKRDHRRKCPHPDTSWFNALVEAGVVMDYRRLINGWAATRQS